MSATADTAAPALEISGVVKLFGAQRALNGVDFTLKAGEVHGLIGQNGSGKSTLIKLIAGYHQPDELGRCELNGEPFPLGDAAAAHQAEIRFVHQDLALVGSLDAVENFALTSRYQTRNGLIRWRAERKRVRVLLARLGYDFDLATPVAELAPSERVGLAIARALEVGDGRLPSILVLDEPTAALPAPEVASLFRAVEAVRAHGVAVIYVSHRLEEVLAICDRVTVLRDGNRVAVQTTDGLDTDALIELMLGQSAHMTTAAKAAKPGPELLTVRGLSGAQVDHLDLSICQGEVIGIAGVTGSGRDELAGLIAGAVPTFSGTVTLAGHAVRRGSVTASVAAGLAYLPSDRVAKALIPVMNVRENMTLLNFRALGASWMIRRRSERRDVTGWLDRLDVRPRRGDAAIFELSGGNQQKVVLARLLRLPPKALVLDEPTQGVDVGASAAIHDLIRRIAIDGACALVCSTDTEELVTMCDKVLVLKDGRVAATFDRESLTVDALDRAVLGADAVDILTEAEARPSQLMSLSEVEAS